MADTINPGSFCIEFRTTSILFPLMSMKIFIAWILAFNLAFFWLLHLSQIHFVIFWSVIFIVIVASILLVQVRAITSSSVQGHTKLKDGFITVLNSRNQKPLYKFPYSEVRTISVGSFPNSAIWSLDPAEQDEMSDGVPVFLIADTKNSKGSIDSIWIKLFDMRIDEESFIAHVNGQDISHDRTNISYMDVAERLTSELCDVVGTEMAPCGK